MTNGSPVGGLRRGKTDHDSFTAQRRFFPASCISSFGGGGYNVVLTDPAAEVQPDMLLLSG